MHDTVTSRTKLRVWDLPTRLFHWSLVGLIAGLVYTGTEGGNLMEWHVRFGYAVLALLLFRLAWGFAGSRSARFSDFVRGPRAVVQHLQSLRAKPAPHAGHNPAGGWMVIALLLCVAVQVGTGLFANDDILTEGPLAHWVSEDLSGRLTGIHELNFNLLLGLVSLHVLASLFYLFKGDNLFRPMLTGRKAVPAGTPVHEVIFVSTVRAAALLAGAAALVWLLVSLA